MKSVNPQDEFFLIRFDDRPVLTSTFTAETDKIQNDLAFVQSKGRSALWDAIYLGLNEIKKGHNPRKALLVISDGGDNSSRYTENEIEALAREVGVHVYAVGVYEPAVSRGRTAEELTGPARLSEIAEQSGGQHLAVESLEDIPIAAAKFNSDVRSATTIP